MPLRNTVCALASAWALACSMLPHAAAAGEENHVTHLDGTFIQPWLYMTYDDAQWDAEMQAMKDTGIQYLIMGDVANHNADGSWTVYYPSELDFLSGYTVYDALEPILFYCDKYDIKLYLGMGLDCAWNSDIASEAGREANRQYMEQCNQITSELYNKYKASYPDTYYGFYFVTELYNTIYMDTDTGIDAYAEGLEEMFTLVLEPAVLNNGMVCPFPDTAADEFRVFVHKLNIIVNISGPFNIQFLARENAIKVIECNLRASRSFPFVSKVLKIDFIELATKVMLGLHPAAPQKSAFDLDYVGVKSSQFSFARLEEADPMLGVDMSSTGEVGCLGDDLNEALLKSVLSVGQRIPERRILLSTGDPLQKADMLGACRLLVDKGYELYATGGTYKYLVENSVPATKVLWPSECDNPNFKGRFKPALEMIQNKEIDMVINIPKNFSELELSNGYQIRRAAIDFNVTLFTNARLATAFIRAFCSTSVNDIHIKSWDQY
mgnify:CR=1 FL=1